MSIYMKNQLNRAKFLICGGCGFMGSNFIRYLLKKCPEAEVVNLDLLTYAGNLSNLQGVPKSRYRFVKGDICDSVLAVRLMEKADFVVNFAAETHVDRSIHGETGNFIKTNVLGVYSLLQALRESPKVKKLVHISTDEVWGDLELHSRKKFDENSPFLPNSPYAASKAAGDLLIKSFVKTYKLPVIVSHSVNNFGPRQFPEKLIPFFTIRALQNLALPLYGDGKNIRDWIFVDDHSEAIRLLLEKSEGGGIYAIAREDEHSNLEIAKRILSILKKPSKLITFVADRPGHDRRYSVNAAKIRQLGWKPRHSLDAKLEETVRWYKEHPKWWKEIFDKRRDINKHI